MKIIIVTGLARSGKDTVTNFIARKYSYKKFIASDLLKEELEKTGRPITKKNMETLGIKLRKQYGLDVMARQLWDRIKKYEKVVISGLRSPEDIDWFKAQKRVESVAVIAVTASNNIRFGRRNIQDAITKEHFFERDTIDMRELGLKKIIESADYTIKNESSLEILYNEIKEIMVKIV